MQKLEEESTTGPAEIGYIGYGCHDKCLRRKITLSLKPPVEQYGAQRAVHSAC